MAGAGYPQYVQRGGEQCHPQPYDCQNVAMYGFFLEGQVENLQALVDRCLNQPTGGALNYRVLSPLVLVTFASVAEGRSVPPNDIGYVPELSCTTWLLTAAVNGLIAKRIRCFVPYIVVDNGYSLAAGREVYGFPKELGTVQMPRGDQDPATFRASTMVLPTYSAATRGQVEPVIEIARVDAPARGSTTRTWGTLEEGFKDVVGMWAPKGTLTIPGLGLIVDLLEHLAHKEVPAVFLKQFRDTSDGTRACYQAIVETSLRVTTWRGGGLLSGTYSARVCNFQSHPIQTDLGLADGPLPAKFPFVVDVDFLCENGTTMWSATDHA